MGRRRKKSLFGELVGLAVVIAVMLALASSTTQGATGMLAPFVLLIRMMVTIAVLVLAGALLFKVVRWLVSHQQRSAVPGIRLDLQAPHTFSRFEIGEHLDALDWYQLEKLTAALFEAKGTCVETRGGAKADGGIDMVVGFNGAKAAVQCKHWAKWHCGPGVVRELVGAMTIEKIPRGFLICRSATVAAQTLADSNQITIVEREGLIDRIEEALRAENAKVRSALTQPKKLCPKCGAAMVLRSAGRGPNAGSQFWGCSTYPKCHQTMKV